jgi:hypothetical protein
MARNALLALCLLLASTCINAATYDGSTSATYACGANSMLGARSTKPFSVQIALDIKAGKLSGVKEAPQVIEQIAGTIDASGKVVALLEGHWKNEPARRWSIPFRGIVEQGVAHTTGPMLVADGVTRARDCSLTFNAPERMAIAAIRPAPAAERPIKAPAQPTAALPVQPRISELPRLPAPSPTPEVAAAPANEYRTVATRAPTPMELALIKGSAASSYLADNGSVKIADVDLDGDGTAEILVFAESSTWCGSDGCASKVLKLEPSGNVVSFDNDCPYFGEAGSIAVGRGMNSGFAALHPVDPAGNLLTIQAPGAPNAGKVITCQVSRSVSRAPASLPATVPAVAPDPPKSAAKTPVVAPTGAAEAPGESFAGIASLVGAALAGLIVIGLAIFLLVRLGRRRPAAAGHGRDVKVRAPEPASAPAPSFAAQAVAVSPAPAPAASQATADAPEPGPFIRSAREEADLALKEQFAVFDRAGEPNAWGGFPRNNGLTDAERRKISFNLVALVVGGLAYFFKGMPLRGFVFLAALTTLSLAIGPSAMVLNVSPALPGFALGIGSVVWCGRRLDYDYYRQVVHGERIWKGVRDWYWVILVAGAASLLFQISPDLPERLLSKRPPGVRSISPDIVQERAATPRMLAPATPPQPAPTLRNAMSVRDFMLDAEALEGREITLRGYILPLGDGETTFLYPEPGVVTGVIIDTKSALSRADRARILSCGDGCWITLRGIVHKQVLSSFLAMEVIQ